MLTEIQKRKLESLPWLKELQAPVHIEVLSYAEAQKVVQKAGIKTTRQFHAWKRPAGVPGNPNTFYKNAGWHNWKTFLGTEFLSYKEAQRVVQQAGIKAGTQFHAWKRPAGVPRNPNMVYKNAGWTNWNGFFGTAKYKTAKNWIAAAVRLASSHDGKLPTQAWCRAHGYSGIFGCMHRNKKVFRAAFVKVGSVTHGHWQLKGAAC